ncbi:MAG: hypothetical protein ACI89X_003500 [Planctomycetota bacterium]|jgi:hypothetical protein
MLPKAVAMNLKSRNLVLGVVCLVLAIPTALQLYDDADTFVDVGRIPLMFQGFTSDNAGVVLIAEPKAQQPERPANANPNRPQRVDYNQLVLKLQGDTWRIGQLTDQDPVLLAGAPIKAQRLESDVFHHLRMIRNDPETLVQANATEEQLKKYGLDVEHAYLIKVVDKAEKNVLAEVFVGDDSSVGRTGTEAVRGVFVRQVGSNDVVLYEWEKPWRRNVETDEWTERVLARVQPPQVRKLTIKNLSTEGKTFVFEREPGKSMWSAKGVGETLGAVRQTEIEGLIQRFGYLAVDTFERSLNNAGNMTAYGLHPAQTEVTFTFDEAGTEKVVQIAIGTRLKDQNIYYMTCSLEPSFIMTWGSSMVTNFELDVATRLFDPK